jgi:hypothetical protein
MSRENKLLESFRSPVTLLTLAEAREAGTEIKKMIYDAEKKKHILWMGLPIKGPLLYDEEFEDLQQEKIRKLNEAKENAIREQAEVLQQHKQLQREAVDMLRATLPFLSNSAIAHFGMDAIDDSCTEVMSSIQSGLDIIESRIDNYLGKAVLRLKRKQVWKPLNVITSKEAANMLHELRRLASIINIHSPELPEESKDWNSFIQVWKELFSSCKLVVISPFAFNSAVLTNLTLHVSHHVGIKAVAVTSSNSSPSDEMIIIHTPKQFVEFAQKSSTFDIVPMEQRYQLTLDTFDSTSSSYYLVDNTHFSLTKPTVGKVL